MALAIGQAVASSLTAVPETSASHTPSILHRGEPALTTLPIAPEPPAASPRTEPVWMSQALPIIIRGTDVNAEGAFTSPQGMDSEGQEIPLRRIETQP